MKASSTYNEGASGNRTGVKGGALDESMGKELNGKERPDSHL